MKSDVIGDRTDDLWSNWAPINSRQLAACIMEVKGFDRGDGIDEDNRCPLNNSLVHQQRATVWWSMENTNPQGVAVSLKS